MMNKMMSVAAFAAALTLTASCALAATADAKIVAPNTEKITAPFAGTLLPFDYETGDSVSAHETLFTLDTTPVYATQAGTVSAVFASVGDDASGVAAHYGALAVVEPKNALYIDASTEQAYDDADNRYIHAGESLYLKMGNTKGTGVVTGVSGKKYTVEILTGDYDVNDTVRCFRESTAPSDSEVGRGKVTRYADVQVLADSGRIAAVHVKPGDTVEVVGPDCKPFSMVVPEMRDAEGFTLLEPRNPRMIFTMQLPRSVPAMSFVRHAVDLSARD